MKIKVISTSNLNLPKYETIGSAGMDLLADVEGPVILKPMERKLISTGIFLEIPEGFEGQVRPRSGLAIKHGITLINCVGTIDSDYRGEIRVPLINLGTDDFEIKRGDRMAQLVLCKYERIEFVEVEEITVSDRGGGGFGSTGMRG